MVLRRSVVDASPRRFAPIARWDQRRAGWERHHQGGLPIDLVRDGKSRARRPALGIPTGHLRPRVRFPPEGLGGDRHRAHSLAWTRVGRTPSAHLHCQDDRSRFPQTSLWPLREDGFAYAGDSDTAPSMLVAPGSKSGRRGRREPSHRPPPGRYATTVPLRVNQRRRVARTLERPRAPRQLVGSRDTVEPWGLGACGRSCSGSLPLL
jgi:hypothetical protein